MKLVSKKSFKIVMALFVLSTMLCGCGGGGTPVSSGQSSTEAKEGETSEVKSDNNQVTGDVITIISAGASIEEHFQSIAMDEFEKYVEEKSNGSIQVDTYPNQQMGSDGEILEAAQLGNIQVGYANCSNVATVSDSLYILDHPFLFNNIDQAYKVLDGEVGDYLLGTLDEAGIVGLGWLDNGFRELTTNVEVHSPDDLKGQKIRTMENSLQMAAWEMLGASPTPMAYGEVFTALQQKTIDGQENPLGNITSQKFYEVQKYVTFTDHIYSANPIFINKSFFETLTDEQKTIIREAADVAVKVSREKRAEQDVDYLKTLEENCQITNLTDEEKTKFQEAVRGMYDLVVEKAGQEIVDKMYAECGLTK